MLPSAQPGPQFQTLSVFCRYAFCQSNLERRCSGDRTGTFQLLFAFLNVLLVYQQNYYYRPSFINRTITIGHRFFTFILSRVSQNLLCHFIIDYTHVYGTVVSIYIDARAIHSTSVGLAQARPN